MVTAYRAGAPLQKLFPGVAGGAAWVKAVSSALPMLNINPTSGVTLENAGEYLNMGAASVGLVAPLFDPVAIANEDWDQIAKNAEIGKLIVLVDMRMIHIFCSSLLILDLLILLTSSL